MLFLRKYILAAIALALFYSQTLITSSFADSPKFRKIEISGGINAATLYVNQDGNRWTQLLGYETTIPVYVDIEMSKGYIEFYRIGRNLTDGAVRGILLTHEYNNSGTPYESDVDSSTSVNKTTDIAVEEGGLDLTLLMNKRSLNVATLNWLRSIPVTTSATLSLWHFMPTQNATAGAILHLILTKNKVGLEDMVISHVQPPQVLSQFALNV